MFENQFPSSHLDSENIHTRRYNTALDRFQSARNRGVFSRLKRKITHQRQTLYDLEDFKPYLSSCSGCYTGLQVVRINWIIGSESRTADFDIDFFPLRDTLRERWINMAIAHLERISLPPISLIQIGRVYFVRDGHHRISVSRTFGQIAMDADVISWKASGHFPWLPDTAQNRNQTLLEHPAKLL